MMNRKFFRELLIGFIIAAVILHAHAHAANYRQPPQGYAIPPVTVYAPPQPAIPLALLPLAFAAGIVALPFEVLLAPVPVPWLGPPAPQPYFQPPAPMYPYPPGY